MREILAILGPTAVGKSGLAMHLCTELGGEIVSADALQVYRGLDVGTAKPSPQDRSRVRHHLVDIKDPDESFSAGQFARLARSAIEEISCRRKSAVLVGGSGLYIRALLEGISEIPEVAEEVRTRLRRRLAAEGLDSLHRELERVDPATAARLAPGDTQRVLRALEVVSGTGRRLSDWIAEKPSGAPPIKARRLGLTLPRALLYDRIRSRVESMLEAGWLREVESLLNQGYSGEEPAFQAIGYRQLVRHLREGISLEEAMEDTVRSIRQYAKRQLTWFRKQASVTWYDASDPESLQQEVRAWVSS